MPFPASGNPRQEFANGKLTNDGNSVAAYSSRYPCQQKRESNALYLFCRIAILPFPVSGNPRQEFANGKLTNDGNNVAAYSSRYPANKKERANALHLLCRIAILPFPASGDPRQEFAEGKLTNDGNSVAAYSSRYPANKKERAECSLFFVGRGDAIRTRNLRFWRPLLYR